MIPSFDPNIFTKTINCKALLVQNNLIHKYMKHKVYLNDRINISRDIPDKEHKYLILKQDIKDNEIQELNQKVGLDIQSVEYQLKYGFNDMTLSELLRECIPKEIKQLPSSFETIGQLAHMNLKPHLLPYRKQIAQIILIKNKHLKTIVNKTESLSNVFRTPTLEVIGGENNLETIANENGCKYKLNYEKVYWNSRLSFERKRMLEVFGKGTTICDMFCGVGPMAIQSAKYKCHVIANDLNPDCYEYLNQNVKLNKISSSLISTFNMDARDFLEYVIKAQPVFANGSIEQNIFQHVYMNLPGDAILFLDVFNGFLKKADCNIWNTTNLPMIHVYTFESGETLAIVQDKLSERVKDVMPGFQNSDIIQVTEIRDISSLKKMYCLSFRLSEKVAEMDIASKQVKI